MFVKQIKWIESDVLGLKLYVDAVQMIIPDPAALGTLKGPGKEGANGFEGMDHYHIYNPDSTGKMDYYIDKNGNPVPKGSKPSHIVPEKE